MDIASVAFPAFGAIAVLATFVVVKVLAEAHIVKPRRAAAYAAPRLGDRVSFPFAGGRARGTVCRFSNRHVWLFGVHRRTPEERARYLWPGHTVRRSIAAVTRL